MTLRTHAWTGLSLLGVLFLAGTAQAGGRNPASLLLYPEFDNRYADLTLVTVTNTNDGLDPNSPGTVGVEFIYIGRYGHGYVDLPCLETNRTEILTANDTFTAITSAHNPQHEQGFMYAFAKDAQSGAPIAYNFLIGNVVTMEGITQLEYSMNPVAFRGIFSDEDSDDVRDLDGVEYEQAPDEVMIPRFIGSSNSGGYSGLYDSELILIGLSGGARFDTVANFWVYNDNEEAFSAQWQFRCWDRVKLSRINGVFTQDFLKYSTNHNPNEILGASYVEAGWIRVYGALANSTAETIVDPAVYAVLVERIGDYGAADLPFESLELQDNGDLFPVSVLGDPDPGVNNDNQ